MGDINLLFEVEGGGSLASGSGKQIKDQLDSIVQQINANSYKISFDIDPASLTKMQGDIKKISDEIRNIPPISFSSGTSSLEATETGLENIKTVIDGLSKSFSSVGSGGAIDSLIGKLEEIRTLVESISNKNFTMNITNQNMGEVIAETERYRTSLLESAEAYKYVYDIATKVLKRSSEVSNVTDAMNKSDFISLQNKIIDVDAERGLNKSLIPDQFIKSIESAKDIGRLSGVANKISSAMKELTPFYQFLQTIPDIADMPTLTVPKFTESASDILNAKNNAAEHAEDIANSSASLENVIEVLGRIDTAIASVADRISNLNPSDAINSLIERLQELHNVLTEITQHDFQQFNAQTQNITINRGGRNGGGNDNNDNNDNFVDENDANAIDRINTSLTNLYATADKFGRSGLDIGSELFDEHSITDAISELNVLKEQIQDGGSQVTVRELNDALTMTGTVLSEARMRAQEAKTAINDIQPQGPVEEIVAQSDAIRQLDINLKQLITTRTSLLSAGGNKQGEVVGDLNSAISSLNNLKSTITDSGIQAGVLESALNNAKNVIAAAGNEIANLKADSSSIKTLQRDTDEYNTELNTLLDLLNKVKNAQKAWTDAGGSQDDDTYKKLSAAATALSGSLEKLQTDGTATSSVFKGAVRSALRLASDETKNLGKNVEETDDKAKSMASGLQGAFSQLVQNFLSPMRIMNYVINAIREGVKVVIELDDALTQMQIVTRDTEETVTSFGDKMFETAQRVGGSVSELIDSATVFARLGYTMSESGTLAEYTAMLQNVGDISTSDAQDAITAIIKAYDIGVDEIESVMDKLVVVGNNYPVSVAELATGMNNASSALHAAGNTFDESLALLTAANVTIQNMSKASTGLRTITARIRNTKTELDELGETVTTADYQDIVDALTKHHVAIMDVNGDYRSTYDIISDIAEVWDDMTSAEQASLAETLSGTRQQNIFYSLVEQFNEASKAMVSMENSAGTLEESYSTFMDSTTAHINQFKATWQGLVQTIIKSDLINAVVDAGTMVIGFVDKIASFFSKSVEEAGGLISVIEIIKHSLGLIGGPLTTAIVLITDVIDAFRGVKQASVDAGNTAMKAFSDASETFEQNKKSLELLSEEYDELSKKAGENGSQGSLTNDEYERYLEIINQIIEISPEVVKGYNNEGKAILDYTNLINDATEANQRFADSAKESYISSGNSIFAAIANEYDGYADNLKSKEEEFANLSINAEILSADNLPNSIDLLFGEAADYAKSYSDIAIEELKDVYKNADTWQEMLNQGGIDFIKQYTTLLRGYTGDNGYRIFSDAEIESAKQSLYEILDIYGQIDEAKNRGADWLSVWADSEGLLESVTPKIKGNIESILSSVVDPTSISKSKQNVTDLIGVYESFVTGDYFTELYNNVKDGGITYEKAVESINEKLNDNESAAKLAAAALAYFTGNEIKTDSATNNASESIENQVRKFGSLTDAISESESRLAEYDEILNGADYDNDYNKLTKYIEQAQELLANGEFGSKKLQAIKDVFGISDADASEAKAYFDEISKYFTEGTEGLTTWLSKIEELNASGELAKGIASFNSATGKLEFDPDKVSAWADELNMSEDALLALIQMFAQFSDDFVVPEKIKQDIEGGIDSADNTVTAEIIPDTSAFDEWLNQIVYKNVGINFVNGGSVGDNTIGPAFGGRASGVKNLTHDEYSLLGDEYSPNGAPRPELVVGKDGAYIAGTNGPTVSKLNKGDTVYTYDETKDILKGNGKKNIPAFKSGLNGLPYRLISPVAVAMGDIYGIGGVIPGGGHSSLTNLDNDKKEQKEPSGEYYKKATDEAAKSFEDLYKHHQHLLKMDQENQADYLKWLDQAYKDAYEAGEIELDDFRKYEEEVYSGLQDLFNDYLKDQEHEIEMLANAGGNDGRIVEIYRELMAAIEKEIQDARDRGLGNDSDYIQNLQNNWWSYYSEIEDMQDEYTDDSKDAIDDLVQYRIKMLKQELENEKDNLNKRLSNLKDFYDKQKEMLQDTADEEDYLKEQTDKRKAVADIEAKIDQLRFDNSAAAQKKLLQLREDLLDAQTDLDEFEKDHALEVAQEKLDELYEMQEKSINAEIDEIDDKLNDPQGLYEQALADVRNNSVALYEEMIAYNAKYGDGIKQTVTDMWEGAYVALKKYYDLYGEYYNGINLVNATGYVAGTKSAPRSITGYASGTRSSTAGLHKFNERGDEFIFTSADGTKYRMFSAGEKVLNAGATNFLYDFANSGGRILSQLLGGTIKSGIGQIANTRSIGNVSMGDIIIQGNANAETVSAIRREQRAGVDYLLRKFAQLNT